MQNNRHVAVITLTVGIVLIASSAFGQVIYAQPASGSMRVIYTHWSVENGGNKSTIDQWMIPVSGFVPLEDNMEVRFYVANATHSLDYMNSDYSLSGLSDMRLQLNRSFSDDRLLVSLGVNLPTGKKKLSIQHEWLVMEHLSQNYLSFPVRRLGEGAGFNVLLGGAAFAGSVRYGGSVMYQFIGEYEPYDGLGDYDPGDLFSLQVGADTKKDRLSFSANLVFSTYATDKLDGNKSLRPGRQFEIRLGGGYDAGKYTLRSVARYLLRGRNTRYDSAEEILDQLRLYGNEFCLSGGVSWHPDELWSVAPSVDLRLIGANEYDLGSSAIFGLGTDIARNIGEGVDLGLGFKYYTGSADGGDIDVSGYQLSADLMASF